MKLYAHFHRFVLPLPNHMNTSINTPWTRHEDHEIHIEITYKSVMSSHTPPPHRPPPTHWNVLFAPWQWKRSETKAKLCAVCFKSWTAGNALSYVTPTPHIRGPNSIYRLAHSTFAPDDDVRGAEIHLLAGRDGERVNYTSSSPVTSLHDPDQDGSGAVAAPSSLGDNSIRRKNKNLHFTGRDRHLQNQANLIR